MRIDILKKTMEKEKITMNQLSKKSNVGYATIYDILNGNVINPRVDTLKRIVNSLGLKIEDVIGEMNYEESKGNIENKM